MKVVLFCGGFGTRLRDYSETVPKPMVPLGYRPVMWHVMKYYASFGHTDFVLALGYQADVIKSFFLNYNEAVSNDFVLSEGGQKLDMMATDIHDWRITFVDTGYSSNIGERLKAVQRHVEDEEIFLANYSDGLTDLPLDDYIADFEQSDHIAQMLLVEPPLSYHKVATEDDGTVTGITPIYGSGLWINGGYFVFRREFFDYINPGEEMVVEPFLRLIDEGRLGARRYNGFWAPMDTFKDKQRLDDLWASGHAPWTASWNGGTGS
jgi:glucose-1-phosphate cytidylyltransferase